MAGILELKNMCKCYGSFAASKDISLKIKKGTVHAVMSENGAGKSTSMNIIAGVNRPTSGEIFPDGKKVSLQDANSANRAGTGMVQQGSMLLGKLSVLDNIIIGYEDTKRGFFISKKESSEKIENICEGYRFHLDLNMLIRDLPAAIQQQVEIVKVLFRKADIIILGEPMAALPYQKIQGLLKAIRYLISRGKTVISVTHKLREVLEIPDTTTVMKGGVISEEINAGEATELTLASMAVGRDVVLKLDKQSGHPEKEVLSAGNLVMEDDRRVTRVKDASFCLREGGVLGIVGVSGSGQNELVETITGVRGCEMGTTCPHEGKLPTGTPQNSRLKHIDCIPQGRVGVGSPVDSSLARSCIIGYHLNHLKKKGNLTDYRGAEPFADSTVEKHNVKTRSNRDRAGSLSGGNLQKLAAGRELFQDRKVLLIEDPTRGIDIGSIEFIWKEIQKQVEREGVSVIPITHDLAEVMTLNDRVLAMYDRHINKESTGPDYDEEKIGMYMIGSGSDER